MAATATTALCSSVPVTGIPGEIHTVQKNEVGTIATTHLGQTYVYLSGVASTLVDDWVTYTALFAAVRLIADAVGPVAIATAAIVASNWGWYLIKGSYATANSDTVAAAGSLWIDGTTGRVDDASVAGDNVYGAASTGADATNKLPVLISFPFVTNGTPT